MGVGDVLKPAGDLFSGAGGRIASYAWVLWIFVAIFVIGAVVYFIYLKRSKNAQWSHKLKVRRVQQNGLLSEPYYHKMRRFPLVKNAEVFELEKPLLGGYLIPELDEYSGNNEYSIILDKNNRIYTNLGEYFNPDKSSVDVSARHAEIDLGFSDLKANFQDIHKTTKRLEWATIAKFTFMAIAILAVMVVAIVGIGEWGEAQASKAQADQAQASAMSSLAEAMKTVEATVNVQNLMIPKLKDTYGTENIQYLIKESKNETV